MSTFSIADGIRYGEMMNPDARLEHSIDWVNTPLGPMPKSALGLPPESIDFGAVPDLHQGGFDPIREMMGQGRPSVAKPSGGGGKPSGWKGAIGGILQSGIDAAATPNVAGGSIVDVFRGMQNAGNMSRQRDIADAQLRRQAGMDDLNRQKTIADIDHSQAQTDVYRSAAEENRAQADAVKSGPKLINVPAGGIILDGTTGKVVVDNRQKPDPKPFVLKDGEIAYDGEGRVIARGPEKKEEPKKQPQTAGEKLRDETSAREELAKRLGLQGRDLQVFVATGKIEAPPKPGKADKPDVGTRVQFANVEHKKNVAMSNARQKAMKAQAEAGADGFGGAKPIDEGTRKRIWDEYNSEMEMIQQGYEAEITALGGKATTGAATSKKWSEPLITGGGFDAMLSKIPGAGPPPTMRTPPPLMTKPIRNATDYMGAKFDGAR